MEIVLIHHTDCGMLTFTDDGFKGSIKAEAASSPPGPPSRSVTSTTDVRQSIARIKASPFVPKKDSVRGFVFDVATGNCTEVA